MASANRLPRARARPARSQCGRTASRTGRAPRRPRTARRLAREPAQRARDDAEQRLARDQPNADSAISAATASAVSGRGCHSGGSMSSSADGHRQRGRAAPPSDQPRPGERQIEMRVGEDLRQLDRFGEHRRFAQRLSHRVIGQAEAGAERQHDDPGEQRPAASRARAAPRRARTASKSSSSTAAGAEPARATRRGASHAARASTSPAARCSKAPATSLQAARMRKRKPRRIASPIGAGARSQNRIPSTSGHGKAIRGTAAVDAALDAPGGPFAGGEKRGRPFPAIGHRR